MSAIAGYLDFGGQVRPDEACQSMLIALRAFGPDGLVRRRRGAMCIGVAQRHVLPEDDLEPQPLFSGKDRYLLAVDGRIDNRSELASKLGLSNSHLAALSDARLLLTAWERWGLQSFDHILGDLALAVWDADRGALTLARSPLSLRTLCYHRAAHHVAFASIPAGIFALAHVSKVLNLEEIAAISAGGVYVSGPSTVFEGISLVRPGEAVEFANGGKHILRLWNLDGLNRAKGSIGDLGEALRSEFDRAVSAQLRRREKSVACQLSAGRDSGAVASAAALALQRSGKRLIAYTAAPRAGFLDGPQVEWLSDESGLAASTANLYRNIDHRVCRPDGVEIVAQFDELHRHHFGPLLNPSNLPWWSQINRAGSQEGASIMLVGTAGNLSISAGGQGALLDLWRERGPTAWLHEAALVGGFSPAKWRGLGAQTIGPWLPRQAYGALMRLAGRSTTDFYQLPTLWPPLRQMGEAIRRKRFDDPRPPRGYRTLVKDTLARIDNAEKISSALWGLDVRDPTSDRRVVELCLSFPAEAYFSAKSARPVFDAAFGNRLPPEVLRNNRRGYQTADWFELFRPEKVREAFRRYGHNPLVRDLIDQNAIDALLDSWPTSRGYDIATIDTYRNKLLGTLAIASFIDVHFPA